MSEYQHDCRGKNQIQLDDILRNPPQCFSWQNVATVISSVFVIMTVGKCGASELLQKSQEADNLAQVMHMPVEYDS